MSVDDYMIVERTKEVFVNWEFIKKTEYEVRRLKVPGLGGFGTRLLATFNNEEDAQRYKEEQVYLEEQAAKERAIKAQSEEKQIRPTVTRVEHERYVQDAYNDWNRAHGYGYR